MGIFSKYIKEQKEYNKKLDKEGTIKCTLKNVKSRKDESSDLITFIFEGYYYNLYTDEIIDNDKYDALISFDFHNKNDNICGYFINNIIKIISAITKEKDTILSIVDKAISLKDLTDEINKQIKYQNIELLLDVKKVVYGNKVFIKPDFNDTFLIRYEDRELPF